MLDFLKGMSSGGWPWVVGWIFPSLIFVSSVALVLVGGDSDLPIIGDVVSLSAAERTSVIFAVALILGLLLSALSDPLYRILEGYLLMPSRHRTWRTKRKRKACNQLVADITERMAVAESAAFQQPGYALETALLQERLRLYPADPGQLGPTRLANAIRAFETYGQDHYGLDQQGLWQELSASVSSDLRAEVASARGSVDFFVSLLYLGVAFAVADAFALYWQDANATQITALLLSLVCAVSSYQLAIVACKAWADAVQAVVNLGRVKLATAMGLRIPATLADERAMWGCVYEVLLKDYDPENVALLDVYRVAGPPPTPNGSASREAPDVP